MLLNNKALSPLVASLLLILVSAVAGILLHFWHKTQQSIELEKVGGAVQELSGEIGRGELIIDGISTEDGENYYVVLSNLGEKKLTNIKVYVNDHLSAQADFMMPKSTLKLKIEGLDSNSVEIEKSYKVVVITSEGVKSTRIFTTKVKNYAYLSNWYREDLKFRIPIKVKLPEGKKPKIAIIKLVLPEDIDKTSLILVDEDKVTYGFDVVWQGSNATIVFDPSPIQEDERIFYLYYSLNTNKDISHENITYKFKVLSVYPCGCLLDDIVNSLNLQNEFDVTCISVNDFNDGNYDLSKYDVVFLDGADCWGGKSLDVEERIALKQFVAEGGGLVFTHDTIGYRDEWWEELEEVAGIVYDDSVGIACWDTRNWEKVRDDTITIYPYKLPSTLSTQPTHITRQRVTTAVVYYIHPTNNICFYLAANEFINGRAAFIQWGHSAYWCNCAFRSGVPPDDEKKAIMNTIFWAARKYDYEILKTQDILPIFE